MRNIRQLKAYLKMCEEYKANGCVDCPLAKRNNEFNIDCAELILKHSYDARDIIEQYITQRFEPLGYIGKGNYRTKCQWCGKTNVIHKGKIFYDDYMEQVVYVCPTCRTMQEATFLKKNGGTTNED